MVKGRIGRAVLRLVSIFLWGPIAALWEFAYACQRAILGMARVWGCNDSAGLGRCQPGLYAQYSTLTSRKRGMLHSILIAMCRHMQGKRRQIQRKVGAYLVGLRVISQPLFRVDVDEAAQSKVASAG